MGYLAELNPDQQAIVDSLLPRIKSLQPGQSLSITAATPSRMTTIRYVWYSYLHQVGLKQHFKLRLETPIKLTFLRRDNALPQIDEEDQFATRFVQDHMLEVEIEAEAQNLCDRHNLSTERRIAVLREWRRFQGLGDG